MPRSARSGRRGAVGGPADGVGWPDSRAAGVPRRRVGQVGHRDRRRPSAPTSATIRHLSGGAGKRAGREPGTSREGTHRAGIRRAHLLGSGDVRAARAQLFTARGRPRCPAVATRDAPACPRSRARELRLAGAAFPWRTIRGEECSGYWPAGTAAFHVNAGIAEAVRRYVAATGDTEFEAGPGLELLVETARLWQSLGHHDAEGSFRIDGVTGPDEYTAIVSNNVYTNLMAARNLRVAADATARYPERAKELGVGDDEVAAWRAAASAVVIPSTKSLASPRNPRVHPVPAMGLRRDGGGRVSAAPSFSLLQSLFKPGREASGPRLRALHLRRLLRPRPKATGFRVLRSDYGPRLVALCRDPGDRRGEVGHLDLAYQYFRESAFVDLRDLDGNTENGLHLAAMAGTLQAAVAGFGGARHFGDILAFAPRLPEPLTRIAIRLLYRGRRLCVEIGPEATTYRLISGEPVEISHHGEAFTLECDTPQERQYPAVPKVGECSPPAGRAPRGGE